MSKCVPACRALPFVIVILLAAGTVSAQHCGGPCEVPRGADPVCPNPRYTLSEGIEKADWRYLFNWWWTEDGVQKYRLEEALAATPLSDFAYRRMFVSPAGNGFLVTGNPYARRDSPRLSGADPKLRGEPPLFVFCDPQGHRLTEVPLMRALEKNSWTRGPCHGCDCCGDVMYVFAQDPTLSSNGCFVELLPRRSWPLAFFLPFGCIVRNREQFEAALEAAEWSKLPRARAAREKKEITGLVGALGSDDLGVRTKAAEGLVAKGFLARTAIHEARSQSACGNFRARAKAVEARLRPLSTSGWEEMSRDLDLLGSLLSYPDKDVVHAVQVRLDRILPSSGGLAPDARAQWIKAHQKGLSWNEAKGRYEGP